MPRKLFTSSFILLRYFIARKKQRERLHTASKGEGSEKKDSHFLLPFLLCIRRSSPSTTFSFTLQTTTTNPLRDPQFVQLLDELRASQRIARCRCSRRQVLDNNPAMAAVTSQMMAHLFTLADECDDGGAETVVEEDSGMSDVSCDSPLRSPAAMPSQPQFSPTSASAPTPAPSPNIPDSPFLSLQPAVSPRILPPSPLPPPPPQVGVPMLMRRPPIGLTVTRILASKSCAMAPPAQYPVSNVRTRSRKLLTDILSRPSSSPGDDVRINVHCAPGVASLIERVVFEQTRHTTGPQYATRIRRLVNNLTEHAELRAQVLSGELPALRLCTMPNDELATPAVRAARTRGHDQGIARACTPAPVASHGMYWCATCKTKDYTTTQERTHRGDESTTVHVCCTKCGRRWKQ